MMDLKSLAREGARIRLAEIAEERARLEAAFPDVEPPSRVMSPEGRARQLAGIKAYWAGVRAKKIAR